MPAPGLPQPRLLGGRGPRGAGGQADQAQEAAPRGRQPRLLLLGPGGRPLLILRLRQPQPGLSAGSVGGGDGVIPVKL